MFPADHFTFFKDLDREEERKSKGKVVQKKKTNGKHKSEKKERVSTPIGDTPAC